MGSCGWSDSDHRQCGRVGDLDGLWMAIGISHVADRAHDHGVKEERLDGKGREGKRSVGMDGMG